MLLSFGCVCVTFMRSMRKKYKENNITIEASYKVALWGRKENVAIAELQIVLKLDF